MAKSFKKTRQGIGSLLFIVLMLISIFITVALLMHRQDNRQRAATLTPQISLGIQPGQPIDNNGNILITGMVVNRISASGAKWVRVNFRLGPYTSDTAQFYLAYDTIVNSIVNSGMQVIGLMSNESWPGSQSDWTANNWENLHGNGENTYIDNFCNEFLRLSSHYQGKITYWEIWNEPNAWATNPSPGVYQGNTFIYPSNFAAMLTQCHSQVHYYNHLNVQVISGGLLGHNLAGYNSGSAGADYLDSTYNAGINSTGKFTWAKSTYNSYPLDAVGQHLYVDQGTTLNTSSFASYLDYVHNVITKWEGTSSPKLTWITELGWTTNAVSETVQSSNMQSAINTIMGKSYVTNINWFQLDDNPAVNYYYGIYRSDLSKKPSWNTFYTSSLSITPTPTPSSIVGLTSTGTVISAILNYYNNNGSAAANGTPYNNGGGIYAHVWDYGYVQDFSGGSIGPCMIFDTGHRVQASFRTTYISGNNHNLLKFPVSDEYVYASGTRQDFQAGYMTWDAAGGVKVFPNTTTPTLTPIPTSNQIPTSTPTPIPTSTPKPTPTSTPTPIPTSTPTPTPAGIVGRTSTGTLISAILNYYNTHGGAAANGTPYNNGGGIYAHVWDYGYVQDFSGGSIGPCMIFDTGHRVQASFRVVYLSGNNHAHLRFPTSDEYGWGAGTRQDFQGGYMTWDATNGVRVF